MTKSIEPSMQREANNTADYWADWLVDAVGGTTQNRALLRGEPEEDKVLTEAILLNGKKAIENALRATPTEPQHGGGLRPTAFSLFFKIRELAEWHWKHTIVLDEEIINLLRQLHVEMSSPAGAPPPAGLDRRASIVTCAVTGAIPGDGGACGDCDPCILGEASVPEPVKRLIAEKNSLLNQISELSDKLGNLEEAGAGLDREGLAQIFDGATTVYVGKGESNPIYMQRLSTKQIAEVNATLASPAQAPVAWREALEAARPYVEAAKQYASEEAAAQKVTNLIDAALSAHPAPASEREIVERAAQIAEAEARKWHQGSIAKAFNKVAAAIRSRTEPRTDGGE